MQVTNTLLLRSDRLEDERAQPLLEPIPVQKTKKKAGSTEESDMDFFGGHVDEYSQASGLSRPSNRSQRTEQEPLSTPVEKTKSQSQERGSPIVSPWRRRVPSNIENLPQS